MTHADTTHPTRKHVLIRLVSTQAKCLEEAVSAAMVMASFDHHVQLALTLDTVFICTATEHKVHKMLTSLELYDMPPLWLLCDTDTEHTTCHDTSETLPHNALTDSMVYVTTEKLTALASQFDTLMNL